MKQPSVEAATQQIKDRMAEQGCSLQEAVNFFSKQMWIDNLEEATSWKDVRDVLLAILRSGRV